MILEKQASLLGGLIGVILLGDRHDDDDDDIMMIMVIMMASLEKRNEDGGSLETVFGHSLTLISVLHFHIFANAEFKKTPLDFRL